MIWKGTVQLIDFDHAGDSDSASLRKERYGTAGCAAPELYTTDQLLDQRTDIYAIGAILRFMLYGTLKAGAETDCGITVSGPLQNIIKNVWNQTEQSAIHQQKNWNWHWSVLYGAGA